MTISPEYTPIAAVGILLVGVIVGAIVTRLVLPSRRQLRRLSSELEALRAEHASYRANVTRHFETTSELVANMTASYKAVYDHLADGAQNLCDGSKTLESGQFGAPRLVFDQRVDVERLQTETPHAASDAPPAAATASGEAASSRAEGPVLEMTKAAPAVAEEAPTNEETVDEAARPSIH